MFKIETLHHVSLPVTNLESSKRFYEEILGLETIEERPPLGFDGAWYKLGGDRQLHLIVHDTSQSTFRERKKLDSRDVHFAVRVNNYHETLEFLRSKGYQQNADDELCEMKESPNNLTPWQQLYIMDPDRNVIELNAERVHDEVQVKAVGLRESVCHWTHSQPVKQELTYSSIQFRGVRWVHRLWTEICSEKSLILLANASEGTVLRSEGSSFTLWHNLLNHNTEIEDLINNLEDSASSNKEPAKSGDHEAVADNGISEKTMT